MTKTSEQETNTIICDTWSLSDRKNCPVIGGISINASSFRFIGHEHDLGDGTNLKQFEYTKDGKVHGTYKRILVQRSKS